MALKFCVAMETSLFFSIHPPTQRPTFSGGGDISCQGGREGGRGLIENRHGDEAGLELEDN